ncbi:MAG: mechanosensitive ion channel family protein [bacterium]
MNFIKDNFQTGIDTALAWITSPAAYAQLGLLIVAFILALLLTRLINPFLRKVLQAKAQDESLLAQLLKFTLIFLPLLMPLIAYALTAAGEQVTRTLFESGSLIAFGKRIFIFIAAWIFVHRIIYSPFLKLLGKYFLLPVTGFYMFGILPAISQFLMEKEIPLGGMSFTADKIITAIVAGSLLFWLGRWSNHRGTDYIRAQENMRPSVRELAAKSFELAVYALAFLTFTRILDLDLATLAVVGGAIGVGIGFGLQKIASNFVSGIILLLEGQASVGDYVALDGGEEGRIIKMMARATILETFDGKWIVVPNEDFITTRVTNYSDSGSANRYDVAFSVSYNTDINKIPDIITTAVAKHPDVLSDPELPDCELVGFGDSGIDFCVEFWVNGLDDGKNKYSSDVLFLIWNALKAHDIAIPFPQREVRLLKDT